VPLLDSRSARFTHSFKLGAAQQMSRAFVATLNAKG
jgi:hypothetical protein